jgi:hypothetical protein
VRAVAAAPNVRVLGLLGGRQRRREEDSGGEGGRRAEVDDAQDRARHTEEDNWSHVSVRAPFIKTVSPPCIILLFYTSFNAKHHQRPLPPSCRVDLGRHGRRVADGAMRCWWPMAARSGRPRSATRGACVGHHFPPITVGRRLHGTDGVLRRRWRLICVMVVNFDGSGTALIVESRPPSWAS